MERNDERRDSRRFEVTWPIEVDTGAVRTTGRTSNVSLTGAFFQSAERARLEEGMIVDVRLNVPPAPGAPGAARAVLGRARVVRLEDVPGGSGIAIHFTHKMTSLPGVEM
jgi:hypothetical protein